MDEARSETIGKRDNGATGHSEIPHPLTSVGSSTEQCSAIRVQG